MSGTKARLISRGQALFPQDVWARHGQAPGRAQTPGMRNTRSRSRSPRGMASFRCGYGTAVVIGGVRSVVQYMHLRAAIGILPRHLGHSRSVAASLRLTMSSSLPTGVTTR